MINDGGTPADEQFDYRSAGYGYMIRVSDRDGYSSRGFKWPEHGHVKPEAWSEDGREGLYGFLHGSGNYALPVLLHDYWHTWQVVVVKVDETRPGIGWGETRVPEGWVKYSGALVDISKALRTEGTPYAVRVADNLGMCIEWMDEVLKGNAGQYDHRAAYLDLYRALPYKGETEAERQRTFRTCLENIGLFHFDPEQHPTLYRGPEPW